MVKAALVAGLLSTSADGVLAASADSVLARTELPRRSSSSLQRR
jgi:hypothetical protein